MKRARDILIWSGAVLSGLLLSISFAPLEMADAAWCALVPLVIACYYVPPEKAWKLGLLAGLVFWLSSIWWLSRVTVIGCVILCAYNSLYMIPFAMVCRWWFGRFGVNRFLLNAGFMVLAVASWTGFEYLRATLFTGFPWHPLGASQYANPSFVQHASWGGVYVLSALLVWANAAIAVTLLRYLSRQARLGRKPHPELMIGMAAVMIAFLTGSNLLRSSRGAGSEVRIALIQPSIPQDDKWTPEKTAFIHERLRTLTEWAVTLTRPELVVWPETALPDDLLYSEESFRLVDELSRLGSPMLVGSMDVEFIMDRRPKFYNTSFLVDTDAVVTQRYDKRHLVLFGEYVPLHDYVRFITAMTPLQESFSPGATSTVFRLPGREDIAFSSLICFEDTLAYLARASVRNGARLLINQTNDAWFDPSAASRQHMALCVFRAVENGVPVIRSANTGYTCAIDARGRIRETLATEDHGHSGHGFLPVTVRVPSADMALTFYTRHGDLFAWACLPFGVGAFVAAWRERRARTAA